MKKPKISKSILIFTVFLIITTLLWFLRALNETYTTDLTVKTKYIDLPKAYGLTSETPESLELKLTGTARNLRQTKTLFKKGLELSGSQIVQSEKEPYLPPAYIESAVKKKLPQDVELLEIISDTLFLKLKKLVSKKVPVISSAEIHYADMHDGFGPVSLQPDSVIAGGAEDVIRKISQIQTQAVKLTDVSDTIQKNIKLQKPKDVSLYPATVSLLIPAERFTEKSIKIQPEIKNLPDSVNFVSFPKTARINFRVGLSNYDSISRSDFTLTADYQSIAQEKPNQYTPVLERYPATVKNIGIAPQTFDYFIEVKSANEITEGEE